MATVTDQELITQTVLDYFEGWFDGDLTRMDRAPHPDLVKRRFTENSGPALRTTTKQRMLELTAQGEGRLNAADRRLDIEVEDVCDDIASVTVRSAPYHEYLHLLRTRGGWKIVNALWLPR